MLHNWLYLNNYYTFAIINLLCSSLPLYLLFQSIYRIHFEDYDLGMFYYFPSPTQNSCHPPTPFYLLILTCVLDAMSYTLGQLSQIQGSQKSTQIDTSRPSFQSNQRYLASDSQTNSSTSFWEQNSKTNVYMILLIVGLSLLVIGGIICCIVITFRYYMGTNRIRQANRVTNDHYLQLDLQMISPQIPYNLFLNEIGNPLHDNCVICLEPYSKQLNNFSSPVNEANSPQLTVSLTVCGHLIHSKCLKEWVNREPNCPLCREPFSDENLTAWQQKLSIDFNYVYQTFRSVKDDGNKKGKHRNKLIDIQKKRKELSLRDSLELQWVKLYNSRPILNKARHAKYNIQNVFSRFLKVKNNKFYLSNITNESPSHTFSTYSQSKCENISLDMQVRQHPDDWIYALMIYSSVMDYHDGKSMKKQTEHEYQKINNIQDLEMNGESNMPNNSDRGGSHQFQSSALDNSQS